MSTKARKKSGFLFAAMTEYMENGASSAPMEETYKEKLLRSLKKEVKHIMEESVMLKCVHEDSASVSSLCASVDACLSYGLKRRALGLFKTRSVHYFECISTTSLHFLLQLLFYSSTIALLHKISKDCEDANTVLKLVHDWEANAGEKRPRSTGDSSSFLSKGSR